jgi:hypothetical protein
MNQQRISRRQTQGEERELRVLAPELPDQFVDDRERRRACQAQVEGHTGLDKFPDRLAKGHHFTLPFGRPNRDDPPEGPFKSISHGLKLEDARPKVKKVSGLAPRTEETI